MSHWLTKEDENRSGETPDLLLEGNYSPVGQASRLSKRYFQVKQKKLLKIESLVHFPPGLQIVNDQWLFGNSEQMRAIGTIIRRISDTDIPVLITGESGVGKELVAHAIHSCSLRKEAPFVKVNCAIIPENLIESELFGYEKGAFTGAFYNKPGRFEFANEGTIFLDEISNLSTSLQIKLLRVLQEGEFFRLGGQSEIKVNARVITATNSNLESMVKGKTFREDLFYRLNVIRIEIPPLREREGELIHLVRYFLEKYSEVYNRPVKELSDTTLSLLLKYRWPGNVRELENVIKRMVILDEEEAVLGELVSDEKRKKNIVSNDSEDYGGDYSLQKIGKEASLRAEREAIKNVLEKTCWNRSQAAKILKISYKTLLYKIKETGLDK
jgi:transcriptional regulator with PAS, ATPase and Fis domain